MATWTGTFIARLAALIEDRSARRVISADLDAATTAYQAFAAYYLGLVTWLGSTAVTAAHRDNLLRASLAQLLFPKRRKP
jgi:hypothetical protein